MIWLKEGVSLQHETGNQTLSYLVRQAEYQRQLLLELTRKIKEMSRSEKYMRNIALLRSVPGVGFITAITFMTEIENIERFRNTDHFAGFIGIVPNRHSTGGKENDTEMTFRGQDMLRRYLIESSWTAARTDPALTMCFHNYTYRMEANKAIIRIARKVLNRIFFVMKTKTEYVSCVVK
jgi:transposase